jgi:hypothetical protein
LKSTLYRNKESKHHEYNRKNQESRIRKTPIKLHNSRIIKYLAKLEQGGSKLYGFIDGALLQI